MPRPSETHKDIHVHMTRKDYDRLVKEARRSTDSRVATLAVVAIIFYLDHLAQERKDARAAAAQRRAETPTEGAENG